ncbi:NAD(P)-dependent oxidoreductase [Synechococcus sp. M16CYN]|uniref:NAD(P)-dependent oxidoreductase n=1 Tax=Synechococcus sp. M16CYN TaxID=3103139 RepID=UPI0030DDF7B5
MTSVAILGTGSLGKAIAQRYLNEGVTVQTWNRTRERLRLLLELGAIELSNLFEVTAKCQVVITVLRDGPVTAKVVRELGSLQNTTLIPMGTMGVSESKNLAKQVIKQGGSYLEAPVLGSKPQALSGNLLVMAGGDVTIFEQHYQLLNYLCKRPKLVGPVGCGAATKLALNQLIASLTHSFSLSLRLIQQAGVSVETFMEILRPSALYAPTFDKKLERMLHRHYADPNFSTSLLRKDMTLFLQETAVNGLEDLGLKGLVQLLNQAKGTELDAQDYCALHELTKVSE